MPHLAAVLLALAVPVGAASLGLAGALGAHPFWELQVALIGAPLGVVAAAVGLRVTRLPPGAAPVLWGALAVAAALAAWWGKTAFVASYAEDRLAGLFWYYGWIAGCAGVGAAIYSTARLLPRARASR